ncbi:hypothetical protein M9458_000613, partial [Cirrhinus mrigala]
MSHVNARPSVQYATSVAKVTTFSKVCHAATRNDSRAKTMHSIENETESMYIGALTHTQVKEVEHMKDTAWYATATIRGVEIKFKLDTGAEANVLPVSIIQKIPGPVKPQPTSMMLVAFGGMRSSPKGVVLLKCKAEKATATLQFYVSDQSDMPILGRAACEQLQLVKRIEPLAKTSVSTKEELINMYPSVFTGLGDPQKGVNSLVITEKKNGSLRVCLDPRDLNKAIKRQHYSIPTPDEVCSNLAGKSIFIILDEKDGYWQIKLDEPSSKLCTFNSPWGRYHFRRLPFGIKSASEVFQQKNCKTFGDIQGVHIIADDMIIAASSEQEHDEILVKVMERAKAAKVRFNGEKIQFKVKTVKYMGHIITPEGLRPDEAKVKAITDMPPPEDKQALQRLLGMTKYLAQYIPKEASLTVPLRQLLRKDAVWQWNPHHSTALMKAPVLRFYDHKKPLTIQTDSSKDGLGACLQQEAHPVCYASQALSDTEQRYAQIEKELLAILFAARKFHQYIYGRKVMVRSDHKPLENIMQKKLCKAPARLQRMLLQLQKYELNIAYTPGKHMHIADMLEADDSGDLYDEKVVHGLEATDALSPQTLQQLKEATVADQVLQDLCEKRRRSVNSNLHSYWPMRHKISVQNGIVMAGDKIIIPHSFRRVILEKLHIAHQGMQRTKAKARKSLYWPGMVQDIEMMVEKCAP